MRRSCLLPPSAPSSSALLQVHPRPSLTRRQPHGVQPSPCLELTAYILNLISQHVSTFVLGDALCMFLLFFFVVIQAGFSHFMALRLLLYWSSVCFLNENPDSTTIFCGQTKSVRYTRHARPVDVPSLPSLHRAATVNGSGI